MIIPTFLEGYLDDIEAKSKNANQHRLAVIFILASTLINSTSVLLVRSLEVATDWQIVLYRGLALSMGVTGLVFLQYRGATITEIRRIGLWGFLGGLFYCCTLIGYVLALTHTTVANAVFTLSTIPLFTAVIAWLVLGERVDRVTSIAIALAFGGISLMVGDGISAGTLFGSLMALMTALCFACFVVVLRKGRATNMLPATAIGALLAALVAIFMLDGDYVLTGRDLGICLVWGAIISSVGHVLIIAGSRHIPGAELTLLILLEFIFTPLWVWLLMNEVPGSMTLIGGAVVLSAAGGRALLGMRRTQRLAGFLL